MVVNAVAGSGKTSTLIAYAKARPQKRILYLAYNRAIATDINEKLLQNQMNNVKASTIHSLAYRITGAHQYTFFELDELAIAKLIHTTNLTLAWLVKDIINFYLNSAIIALNDHLLFEYEQCDHPSDEVLTLLNRESHLLLQTVKTMLGSMKSKEIPTTHDFYLKLLQLSKYKLDYDIIMVDEAQDTSGVMLDFINAQDAQKIFVGDGFQQIYSFRYAINSLDKLDFPEYRLTKSFRFGSWYAKIIESKINEAYQALEIEKTLVLEGTERYTSIGVKNINENAPRTVISRSNLGLFKHLLISLKDKKEIFFEGNYGSYSFMNALTYSLLKLRQEKYDEISHDLVKKFSNYEEAEAYAKETNNITLKNVIELINTYDTELFDFNKRIKEQLSGDKKSADVIYTTTHKAKGCEYSQVIMTKNDFLGVEELKKSYQNDDSTSSLEQLKEEINIFYVAATRVKEAIDLAPFTSSEQSAKTQKPLKSSYKKAPKQEKKKDREMIDAWLMNNH
jgi:superfamily I DNA/RNA helicase